MIGTPFRQRVRSSDLAAGGLEQELADDSQAVLLVERQLVGVHGVRRREVRHPDLLPVALEAMAQHVEAALRVHGLDQSIEHNGLGLRAQQLLQLLPDSLTACP